MPRRKDDRAHVSDPGQLVQRIRTILSKKPRAIVAVAGVPGAGKSTLVNTLIGRLKQENILAQLLPQDGYHYYRSQLAHFLDPAEAFRRRGAPFTFDGIRFVKAVEKLHENVDVSVPLFDHALKDPVENDIVISADVAVVFVEGNYVGLVEEPWCRVSAASDELWLVDTDPDLVRRRLIARHLASGVSETMEEAVERCDGLDGDNAVYIRENLKVPDVLIDLG